MPKSQEKQCKLLQGLKFEAQRLLSLTWYSLYPQWRSPGWNGEGTLHSGCLPGFVSFCLLSLSQMAVSVPVFQRPQAHNAICLSNSPWALEHRCGFTTGFGVVGSVSLSNTLITAQYAVIRLGVILAQPPATFRT